MAESIKNVLFLCTGNSARSILAESILNRAGAGRFRGYSAGSFPTGRVNPFALELLQRENFPTENLHSKSWNVFTDPAAPQIDFIFTVCDNAAGETCPVWPGKPASAHWGIEDPAAIDGSDDDKRHAFFLAFNQLQHRISLFLDLPMDKLDHHALKTELHNIGKSK